MPIKVPGKRYGKRLERSKVFGSHGGGGKKETNADLMITPLVDMFIIIVLFLIMNFSATGEVLMMTNDIELPEAVHVKEIEMAPVVMVSETDIMVSGEEVGTVAELTSDDAYLNIPALEEKLRELKKQFTDLRSSVGDDAGTFTGQINIQAHKEVRFKLIKRVMYSCATAGYGNINFAVLTAGGEVDAEASAALGGT